MKKILKWVSISVLSLLILIFLAIGIVLNFIFTPKKLTPLVENTAREFLNADVRFEKIELTFFSTFPNLGLQLSNATIVAKTDLDSTRQPVAADSLLSVENCLITVNPIAYLKKDQIEIRDFVLDNPHIYAYVDTLGVPNWDIVKPTTDTITDKADTSAFQFNSTIDLKNIRINGGKLIFDDRSTHVYTRIDGLNMEIGGAFLGRTADLKLKLATRNVLFWQNGALLVSKLAFGVETDMRVDRDSLLYTLNKAVFDVNGLKFGAGGTIKADSVARTLDVDLKYGIHIPSLKTILDLVPDTILKKDRQVDVKGDILCKGTVKGIYGKQRIPVLTSEFKIEGGYIAYEGMPSKVEKLTADFYAVVDLQKQQPSYLKLNRLYLEGPSTEIDISADITELITDPVIKSNVMAKLDLASLTKMFPFAEGVICKGNVDIALKTDVLLSDIQAADYGKLKLGGKCVFKDVELYSPKDSFVFKVKSAGVGFVSNRKDKKVVQGVDLLNGVVGYSGLDVNIKNKLRLLMDTTYLTIKTTPLQDTAAIATMASVLHLGKTLVIVRDTLLLGVKSAEARAELYPSKRNKKVPEVKGKVSVDSLRAQALGNRLNLAKADIELTATRSRRDEKIWNPRGHIDFIGLRAYTPMFPLRISMSGTRVRFERNKILLDSAKMRLGRSDVLLTGQIEDLGKAIMKRGELKAELFVKSKMINCNQIMKALDAGTANRAKILAGFGERLTDEDDLDQVKTVSDTIQYEGSNAVFVLPKDVNFHLQTDINRVIFGKAVFDSIRGDIVLKNQCIELSEFKMRSAAAKMDATVVYKADNTEKAYAGFALKMHDIRIDSLVRIVPSLDTLLPMLNSFEGEVDFHIAGETWLDSNMMPELPTMKGAAYLNGHNLVVLDGETFAEISKMLMFKNKKRNMIDSLSVDLMVKDGTIEVFPFMLEIDRYKVAIGGQHHIDMTFNYHVSLLKSPLPFRAGVDVYGSMDKMKFRITKAKYKDIFIPSRKAKVDSTQVSLRQQIRTMLRVGDH